MSVSDAEGSCVRELRHGVGATSPADVAGFDIFDLILIIARNIYLLTLLPVAVGIVALAVAYQLPPTYESTSYLALPAADAKIAEALIRSPAVLDVVVGKTPQAAANTPEGRRVALNKRIRFNVAKGADSKAGGLYTLTAEGPSPLEAQTLGKELLEAWLAANKPGPDLLVEIEGQIKRAEAAVSHQSTLIERLEKETPNLVVPGVMNELASSIEGLRQKREKTIQSVESLKRRLKGGVLAKTESKVSDRDTPAMQPSLRDSIVTPPSLAVEQIWPKKTALAATAAVSTGVALLGIVLFKYIMSVFLTDPRTSSKINEIGRALRPFKRSRQSGGTDA